MLINDLKGLLDTAVASLVEADNEIVRIEAEMNRLKMESQKTEKLRQELFAENLRL